MLSNIFGAKSRKNKSSELAEEKRQNQTPHSSKKPVLNVLVMDGDPTHNWPELFAEYIELHQKIFPATKIDVYQCSWNKCELCVYPNTGTLVHIEPNHASIPTLDTTKRGTTNFKPHFILVRNQPRGAIPVTDCRHKMFGFMMANIPSLNSWTSIYMNLERPLMMGGLRSIHKRIGNEKFPLIPATFYSTHRQMIIAPELPAVIKVAHAHAGMGKIKVDSQVQFRDVSTIIAINDDYCTAEPFIEPEYGIRVQKIGNNNYCVMKKMFTGSGWKSQFGGSHLMEIELTEKYKLWADECSKLFGGMDILAVDAIHGAKDDKDYIIELNGTSIGILVERWREDSMIITEMVLQRMMQIYCSKNEENVNKNSNNNN